MNILLYVILLSCAITRSIYRTAKIRIFVISSLQKRVFFLLKYAKNLCLIAEEIKKVISSMLISGIKDPRITSMVSVTDVEVTNDLSYAYVYVSILGGDEESTLLGLKKCSKLYKRRSK